MRWNAKARPARPEPRAARPRGAAGHPLVALYGGIAAITSLVVALHAVADDGAGATPGAAVIGGLALAISLGTASYAFGFPETPVSPWRALLAAGAGASVGLVVTFLGRRLGASVLPSPVVVGAAVLTVPWLLACRAVSSRGPVPRDPEPDKVLLSEAGGLVPTEPRRAYLRSKRAVDLLFAVVGLVVLVALVPAIVIGNLVANRGPLFYRQTRVGRSERRFRIWKLRTMSTFVPDAGGADWTVDEHDPRITPFGRLLRTTHVDELPQVLNVLRGELSIVGPRPSPVRYAADLLEHLPGYPARQSVPPGLTGWAQVKYGYAGDAVGAKEKLEYDLYYVKHRSLWLDLRIIGRTTRTVLGVRKR